LRFSSSATVTPWPGRPGTFLASSATCSRLFAKSRYAWTSQQGRVSQSRATRRASPSLCAPLHLSLTGTAMATAPASARRGLVGVFRAVRAAVATPRRSAMRVEKRRALMVWGNSSRIGSRWNVQQQQKKRSKACSVLSSSFREQGLDNASEVSVGLLRGPPPTSSTLLARWLPPLRSGASAGRDAGSMSLNHVTSRVPTCDPRDDPRERPTMAVFVISSVYRAVYQFVFRDGVVADSCRTFRDDKVM
jgi:hypothetical protein